MVGEPAAVQGDQIKGMCSLHQMPNPASGAPQPAPPMPFSAPLLQGLATNVLVQGRPAAVAGATGYNTPPHVGLHASDPKMVPTSQQGRVTAGSATVFFGGKPAAKTGSSCMSCTEPGQLVGSASTVLIGG